MRLAAVGLSPPRRELDAGRRSGPGLSRKTATLALEPRHAPRTPDLVGVASRLSEQKLHPNESLLLWEADGVRAGQRSRGPRALVRGPSLGPAVLQRLRSAWLPQVPPRNSSPLSSGRPHPQKRPSRSDTDLRCSFPPGIWYNILRGVGKLAVIINVSDIGTSTNRRPGRAAVGRASLPGELGRSLPPARVRPRAGRSVLVVPRRYGKPWGTVIMAATIY